MSWPPLSRAIRELYFDDFRPVSGPKFRPDLIDNSHTPTYLDIHYIDWSKDLYGYNLLGFYLNIDPPEYAIIVQNLILVCSIPYICYFWFWAINFSIADFRSGSSILWFHLNPFKMLIIPTVFALFLAGATLVFYRIDRNMAYVFFKDPENRKAVDIWRGLKRSQGIITSTVISEDVHKNFKKTGYISVYVDKIVPEKWLVNSGAILAIANAPSQGTKVASASTLNSSTLVNNGQIEAYASSVASKTQSTSKSSEPTYLRTGHMNAYAKSVASSSQLPGIISGSSNSDHQSILGSIKTFDGATENPGGLPEPMSRSEYAQSTKSSNTPEHTGFGFMSSFFKSSEPSISSKSAHSEVPSSYSESAYSRQLLSSSNIPGRYADSSYSKTPGSSSKSSKSSSTKYPESVTSSSMSKYPKSAYSSSSSKYPESSHSSTSSSSRYLMSSSNITSRYADSTRSDLSENSSKYQQSLSSSSSSKRSSASSQSLAKYSRYSTAPSTFSSAESSLHSTISSSSSRYPASEAPTSSRQSHFSSTSSRESYATSTAPSRSGQSVSSSNHRRYMGSDFFSTRSLQSQSSGQSSSSTSTVTPNARSTSNFDSQSMMSSSTADTSSSSLHAQFLGSSAIPGYKDDRKGKGRSKRK